MRNSFFSWKFASSCRAPRNKQELCPTNLGLIIPCKEKTASVLSELPYETRLCVPNAKYIFSDGNRKSPAYRRGVVVVADTPLVSETSVAFSGSHNMNRNPMSFVVTLALIVTYGQPCYHRPFPSKLQRGGLLVMHQICHDKIPPPQIC